MATKTKGMHTAGIYSDMTVDGPEIGTLVVIVDRAKNLPNRKSIGKQDPYCAARLGKEAKKTDTDRRGGQTPRWDQELRFTVHDSPDYYQLKVSVFNDDKKTEIIGETWVNLQEVVVPGGGQNDIWHTLSCKSKYAGEIRIEITYYDTRPKQERPEKVKQAGTIATDEGARDNLKGPRQPKPPVKRRPLPSDPVTGAPAPLQEADQMPARGYPSAPSALPEHFQTPSRVHQISSFVPNQSPLQNVEYSTPPQRSSRSGGYTDTPNSIGYGEANTPYQISKPLVNGRYESDDYMIGNIHSRASETGYYSGEQVPSTHDDYYNSRQTTYILPQSGEYGSPPSPEGPPPAPPAHRSRNNSQHVSPAPPITPHGSYGFHASSQDANRFQTPSQETHRHSMPTYSQANNYQPYSPTKEDFPYRRSANGYHETSPRYDSYDAGHVADYRSMQPTVEDAPPTPGPASQPGQSRGSLVQYDERGYGQIAPPAPLDFDGRGSTATGRNSNSNTPTHLISSDSPSYGLTNSPVSYQNHLETSVSSRTSYNSLPSQDQSPRRQSGGPVGGSPGGYGLPPVPPTLVAGMDPAIAKELSERIYHEKRTSFNSGAGNSSRGRYDAPQYQPNRPHPLSYHENAAVPSVPVAVPYDERQGQHINQTTAPLKSAVRSPDPRIPTRKSVSPAPETSDVRRLSGVPFGPDSYNALNPSLVESKSTPSLSARYDTREIDPDAKIITYDGREIDPSDHIPESNYAPLLESKGPKYASQMPDRNYRPPPSSAQASPASSRRPLRQSGRPQSMTASSPINMSNGPDLSTSQTGRNRLQKKANRASTQAVPHSSPLTPVSSYQDNSFTPRSLPRATTGDFYPSENYAPHIYGSSPGNRAPPAIPAKVAIGATDYEDSPPSQPTGADAWALLEEMKNIDLGSGRARRRGRF